MKRTSLLLALSIGTCARSELEPVEDLGRNGLPTPEALFRADLRARGGEAALARVKELGSWGSLEGTSTASFVLTAKSGAFVSEITDPVAATRLVMGEAQDGAWMVDQNWTHHLPVGTFSSDLIYNDPQLDLNYPRYFVSLTTVGVDNFHGQEVYVVEAIDQSGQEHRLYFETGRGLRVGHHAPYRSWDRSLERLQVDVRYSLPKVVNGWLLWSHIQRFEPEPRALRIHGFGTNEASTEIFHGPGRRWRPRTVPFRARDWSCSAPSSATGFPLHPGQRWSYVDAEGFERATLDVLPGVFDGESGVATLRARGLPFPFDGDRLVRWSRSKGLRQLARVYSDLDLATPDDRQVLIPTRLWVGRRWIASDYEAQMEAWEEVATPAGRFEAARIRYQAPHQPNDRVWLWYAPTVGIVRLQGPNPTTLGRPVNDLFLQAAERRCARPIARMDEEQRRIAGALLPRLSDPDLSAATLDIFESWGPTGLAYLEEVHDHRPGPLTDALTHVRGRLQRLTIETSTGTVRARPHEPIRWRFRLHNGSPIPILVLPNLLDSIGGRYPRYFIEIENPQHEWVKAPERLRFGCGTQSPLSARDFVELLPGESIDPLGPGFSDALERLDLDPGIYRARLVYDVSEPGAGPYGGTGGLSDEAFFLLEEVVRGRFVSEPVTLILEAPRRP